MGQYLFEALLWSDFTAEREYFFIGGLQCFEFLAIHDIGRQKNYGPFILPMTALQQMVRGFPFEIGALTAVNVEALKLLISNCFSRTTSCSRSGVYINKLFRNLTNNVRRVEINMRYMNCHVEGAKWSQFGYRYLKPIFFSDCDTNEETINLPLLFRLFCNKLESVLIFNRKRSCWEPSIPLNSAFVRSLLDGLDTVSSSHRLCRTLKEIVVIAPVDAIETFIEQNQGSLEQRGFKMERGTYVHNKRGSECANCLLITPKAE